MSDPNGDRRPAGYDLGRFDDARDRVLKLESRIDELVKSLATKEHLAKLEADIAKAKLSILVIVLGAVTAIGNIGLMVFRLVSGN